MQEGGLVRLSGGALGRIVQKQMLAKKNVKVVELVTRHATLKVSADHRIPVVDELSRQAEMRAGDLQKGQSVLVGASGTQKQKLTNVKLFSESADLVGLSFDPDWPVEAAIVPARGINTYGERLQNAAACSQTDEVSILLES